MRFSVTVPAAIILLMDAVLATSYPTFVGDQRIVGTYYFYWYDWDSSLHIYVQGRDSLTHHPPDIESFSYSNSKWHIRELRDMVEAGIDFVLPVYWGDRTNIPWALEGLDKLVEAELQLRLEGLDPPKIGMFFDTTALMVEHRVAGRPGNRPNLSTQYGKELFYDMINDFYSHIPPSLWARMDGAAMVWLYSSGWVSDYDQSLVDYVRSRFSEDFNSAIFLVKERSWKIDADMEYGWGAALGPVLRDVAAIGPGFDNEGAVRCYGQSPLKRDRLEGHSYRDDWEQALRAGLNIVVIETWNELHEGTEICETTELGRLYIEMTKNYSRIFKEGTWNRDLKELDSLILFDPQTIVGEPGEWITINFTVTNKGWRSWSKELDLTFFWLNLDGRSRFTQVFPIILPDGLITDQSHTEILKFHLPKEPGRYRVFVSTSYLGIRPELEAYVSEEAVPIVLAVILVAPIITRRL